MIWNRVSIKDSKEIQNTIKILKQYLQDIEKWEDQGLTKTTLNVILIM